MAKAAKFHVALEVAGPTGATAATRYAGGTASGAPASGSFLKGDFVIDQTGAIWICTTAGTPGTWASVSGGGASVTYGTPALTLGTANAAGSTDESIRRDATILTFDATVPATQAFGDSAAAGAATVAARRDHKHAMPATPVTTINKTGATALTGAVTLTGGTNVTLTQSGQDISIAAAGSSGAVATDTIWDTKGDLAAATGADAAVKVPVGANGTVLTADSTQTAGLAWVAGTSVLLYDYEVSGSDKASIDTGADTPQAGTAGTSAFPSGRILEIWIYVRTDEATTDSQINLTFNNDTAGNYDQQRWQALNATQQAPASTVGAASITLLVSGASAQASAFSSVAMRIPNYSGTVGYKAGDAGIYAALDSTAANDRGGLKAFLYHSTSAITRVAFTPNTALKKLKVGTRILIYAR